MASGKFTFFDIPTKEPQVCWSMNIWRSRLVLNYKGVDYETEWLEYPRIAPRLDGHVPPNEQEPAFTLPAMQMPDGSYVMDSYKIADIMEEKYPEPSLHLNTPVQARFRTIMIKFMTELRGFYAPAVPEKILGDKSIEFFVAARGKDEGMPLDEFEKKNAPGAFERAEPFGREITTLLNETSSGPYFLGDTVSYADFIWAADLLFFKCLGEETFQQVLKSTGDAETHTKFLDALSLWTERKD